MRARPNPDGTQPGLADLFRRLGDHASALVRGEVALAKLELRDAARTVLRDSGKLAAAFTLAWFGGLALTAALIIAVAHLLDGRYGFAALIVGTVFLVIGGLLARSGVRTLEKSELRPSATIESLGESRDWARREIRQLRQELKSSPATGETETGHLADSTIPAEERTLQP